MIKKCQIFMLLCLWVMAIPALAATKKASTKAKEVESELSPALAKPVSAALEALQALQEPVKKSGSKRPAAAIRRADGLKGDLREALGKLRDAEVPKDESAAKDAAVVAVASGLRAADLVSQGLQDGDEDQVQTGLKLAAMAQQDLDALEEGGAETAMSGGDSGGDYKIGPSVGGNVSLSGQGNSSNMSGDLSVSFPLSKAMDLGLGGSITFSNSSSGGTGSSSSSSTSLGYGVNAFSRYHFLELFTSAPWVVPYLGLKLGLNSSDNFSTQGYSASSSTSSSTSTSFQLGSLFFLNAKSAMTLQLESSSTNSAGASTPGTLTFSLGARQMF